MNKNRKGLHRVTANVLGLTLASVVAAGTVGEGVSAVSVFAAETSKTENTKEDSVIYLNGTLSAESKGDGSTKDKAVASIDQALKLAGSKGTVLVCGQIVIDSEKSIEIPQGVTFKRAEGFTGAMIKITGKGKLTVSGGSLQQEDVDTAAAALGTKAFTVKEQEKKKEAGTVSVPSQITLDSPEEWKSYDFSEDGFSGNGTFSWASKTAPGEYQSVVQVVFTPKDTKNYDYSQVSGWDAEKKAVIRNVKLTIESLKPEDTASEESQDREEEQKQEEEALTAGQVTIPSEISVQTPEEAENLDFSKYGFQGEGEFSWEQYTDPAEYETKMKVVFTPSDTETKDYSKAEGWDAEKKQVIREVVLKVESLKPEDTDKETEDPEKPQEPAGAGGQTEEGQDQQGTPEEKPEQSEPEDEQETDGDGEQDSQDQEPQETPEEDTEQPETDEPDPSDAVQAEPGKTGEVATEIPEAIPVGSLIDENTGIRVEGDFIPYYVDLEVDISEDLSQLPDPGIGEILSAYEIRLWDLKEDAEYKIPEGKMVKVMIPLPENADDFSQLSIAHYLGNSEYEYYTLLSEKQSAGSLNIETIEGEKYLVFETDSFSPFNVGGSQLVGPGSPTSQKPSSAIKDTGSSSSGNSSAGTSTGSTSQQGQNSNSSTGNSGGQSVIVPSTGTSGSTGTSSGKTASNSQNKTSGSKQTSTKAIRTVKTGDDSPVFLYGAAGAAALILAGSTYIIGKKKKS